MAGRIGEQLVTGLLGLTAIVIVLRNGPEVSNILSAASNGAKAVISVLTAGGGGTRYA